MVPDARYRVPTATANSMDNLNIKGIEDDKPRRRGTKRHGRKGFVLEARLVRGSGYRPSTGLCELFRSMMEWHIHSRYHTESARDQAYASLVRKATVDHMRNWMTHEYRKG